MIYEHRTYVIPPGRMGEILARFRDHTMRLFQRHGIEVVGFWVTDIGPRSYGELVYLCRFSDLNARQEAWERFRNDPEWIEVKQRTEANGPIVERVEVKILVPTDFSPMQ
ncbi:MAG: NIPSNAP family protein [Candidatus Poribacteria bacterium]|nr:MAG: NIPSNAP family protein [Candidatus Poribacteria bacterium]